MKKLSLLFFAFVLLPAVSSAQTAQLQWCGKPNGSVIDTACLRQPLKGIKDNTVIDMHSISLVFTAGGENFTFTSGTDKLPEEAIDKLLSLKDKSIIISFTKVEGVGSNGIQFFTLRGYFTLEK